MKCKFEVFAPYFLGDMSWMYQDPIAWSLMCNTSFNVNVIVRILHNSGTLEMDTFLSLIYSKLSFPLWLMADHACHLLTITAKCDKQRICAVQQRLSEPCWPAPKSISKHSAKVQIIESIFDVQLTTCMCTPINYSVASSGLLVHLLALLTVICSNILINTTNMIILHGQMLFIL